AGAPGLFLMNVIKFRPACDRFSISHPRHTRNYLAIPEHKVPLPGGGNPSQYDLFALAKGDG
ncbi:hypothetical protein D1BOALGB6SA_10244, partial [Olavius sp. associated proteobacterium Delta 1]